jgi:hypothetical protein
MGLVIPIRLEWFRFWSDDRLLFDRFWFFGFRISMEIDLNTWFVISIITCSLRLFLSLFI